MPKDKKPRYQVVRTRFEDQDGPAPLSVAAGQILGIQADGRITLNGEEVPDLRAVQDDAPGVNPFKNTGIDKIVIGEPYSPNSGNKIWAQVEISVTQVVRGVKVYGTTVHRFTSPDFGQILPIALGIAKRFKEKIDD